ncbi:chemotaxis phosphatase CheX-like protein [Mobilisporobacter senegalensis]|uniref:Chemotaxis phosphatase CheX-like protein n=1 Tax=Mobilisporobacter senegalensis TaxID=1329262 RepID=A0A3N1XKI5_9FIRM|nr:chemotaxis protein CheX [Mobilisporobacter senegalensis]ROR27186.1 chemotaxis phosphatase CheX-like protein [Mobilisporobacter senegalensis]
MFGHFLGDYLVKNNLITKSQLDMIVEYQKTLRVKLGTIAITEKLLTSRQADEINNLQIKMDKRFGDIAIEHGYLTEEQVDFLLNLQGSPYHQFVQALIDKTDMTQSDIEKYVKGYQEENLLSDDNLEAIKSGDIDRIAPIFTTTDNPLCNDHIGLALRNIIRFIDNQILIKKYYSVTEYSFDNLASQFLKGEHNILFGFAGKDDSLLSIANPFAKENFSEVDEDAFDSICEFINCINGLFASKLSDEDIDIDLLPPVSYAGQKLIANGNIYVIPVVISGNEVDLLLSMDNAIDVIQ